VRTEDIKDLVDLTRGRVYWRKFAEAAEGVLQTTINRERRREERVLVEVPAHVKGLHFVASLTRFS